MSRYWTLDIPIEPKGAEETEGEFNERLEKELRKRFSLLFEYYGFDEGQPDRQAEAALMLPLPTLKLLIELARQKHRGFRTSESDRPAGRKRDPSKTVDDLILMMGVAEARGRGVKIKDAISGLIEANGWNDSVSTLKRRYHQLQKRDTRERKAADEMVERLRPQIEAHLSS